MKYLKDKIEDAVNATKAAIAEGIVPGGGAALVRVADALQKKQGKAKDVNGEFAVGYSIVVQALFAPFKQIVQNAGRDDSALLIDLMIKKENGGWNAISEEIVDMLEAGIIDPVKVTRSGVENAASAAAVLLTTEAAVADEPEEKKEAPGMGDMGGMGM
jgi:chaperonin GroEL